MKILIINAGSSSLKYQLMESEGALVLAKGNCERIGIDHSFIKHTKSGSDAVQLETAMPSHSEAVQAVLQMLCSEEHGVIASMDEIDAVGHRVVHGGEAFASSALINDEVKQAIRDCYALAPLHNPANMTGIEACEKVMPGVPMVAVFDTAFHQTMPEEAYLYGLPYELYKEHGVRRYGFHGTSHGYVATRAAEFLGKKPEELKIVTCHLGNGSSIVAVDGGKGIDTSMGMTPLAGVLMGTRSGDIDAAIVKYLMDSGICKSVAEVDQLLNKKSGVLGVSGISSDFRDLCAAAEAGDARATLALDVFGYQIKKYVGAYAAAMGGLDVIVFTAGIGENTPEVRGRVCAGLEFMGVEIDEALNQKVRSSETELSTATSRVKVLVIPTNEELAIARETERLCR